MPRTKRTLTLEEVPVVPDQLPEFNADGSYVFIDGDERWRFDALGVLIYYFKTPDRRREPYDEMYRGPRR